MPSLAVLRRAVVCRAVLGHGVSRAVPFRSVPCRAVPFRPARTCGGRQRAHGQEGGARGLTLPLPASPLPDGSARPPAAAQR